MSNESWLRVLVVDDCKDTVESTAQLLGLWGYDTRTCRDGMAVLEAVGAYRPHVVLLDIALPGMDGFEVARRLREQLGPWHALLIAITGHSEPTCRSRAYEVGFARYLIKPVDPEGLRALLRRLAGPPDFREATPAGRRGVPALDLHGGRRLGAEGAAPLILALLASRP